METFNVIQNQLQEWFPGCKVAFIIGQNPYASLLDATIHVKYKNHEIKPTFSLSYVHSRTDKTLEFVRKCIDEETTPEYRDYIYRALTLDFVGVVVEFEDLKDLERVTVKYLGTENSAKFHKDTLSKKPQTVVETLTKILRDIERCNKCRLETCKHMPESKRQFDCLRGQNMKYNLCYVPPEEESEEENCGTCFYGRGNNRDTVSVLCARYPEIKNKTKSQWCGEYKRS
jgi:hypothetical protein